MNKMTTISPRLRETRGNFIRRLLAGMNDLTIIPERDEAIASYVRESMGGKCQKSDINWNRRKLEQESGLKLARYEELAAKAIEALYHDAGQARQREEVVYRINSVEFTKKEVRYLKQKCHPDKNGGSDLSNAVMQKLNKIS